MKSQESDHAKRARQLLDVDPLGLASELATDPSQLAGIGWLLIQELNEERKTSLSELCDSYYRMPWQEVDGVLEASGFEIVSRYPIHGDEEALVAANPEKKMLITGGSSTFPDTGPVLDYSLYLFAQADDFGDHEKWWAIFSSGGTDIPVRKTHHALSYHVTVGLNLKLEDLETAGIAFTDWIPGDDGPRPCFFSGYDLSPEQIAAKEAEIIESLPTWVRDFTKL